MVLKKQIMFTDCVSEEEGDEGALTMLAENWLLFAWEEVGVESFVSQPTFFGYAIPGTLVSHFGNKRHTCPTSSLCNLSTTMSCGACPLLKPHTAPLPLILDLPLIVVFFCRSE